MLQFASPLTSGAAARWSAAGVPRWVPKGALTAGWAAAFVAATIGDARQCTPLNPAICGPDGGFTWWMLCFVTPVLLIWMPLLGCAAGVLFGLADLAFDDVTSANIGFGLHGLACAVVAVWLLRSAVAQERLAADAGGGIRASAPSTPARPEADWNWTRVVAAAMFVVLGAVLIGWYVQGIRAEERHLSAAEQVTGRVVAVDDENFTITLDAAARGGARHVTNDVRDTGLYLMGATTPVFLDANDLSWSRLVAEPQDATDWRSAGLLALLLAGLLALREVQGRQAMQRLRTGEHPALRVWVVPDEVGNALVFPDDGSRPDVVTDEPVARLPLTWRHGPRDEGGGGDWDPDEETLGDPSLARDARKGVDPLADVEWDAATQSSFGRVWRGEEGPDDDEEPFHFESVEPEPAILLGSLRDRGWALLITGEDALVPSGPLRVGQLARLGTAKGSSTWDRRLLSHLPFGPWRHQSVDQDTPDERAGDPFLPGIPVRATGQDRLDLPIVARTPVRTRVLGLAMLASALALAPAGLMLVEMDWFERGMVIFFGGQLLLEGVGRALNQLRLTHAHLEVVGTFRVQFVPWERLHGARRDGAALAIAWEPDLVVDVGPFDADGGSAGQQTRAEQLGAEMLWQRERALARGAAGRPTNSRPGPAWGFFAMYVALVGIALWVVVRV